MHGMWLSYPWRKPYGAWLFTTIGLIALLLPGSVWVRRLYGVGLPGHGTETIIAFSAMLGLVVAGIVYRRQEPPQPGDFDEPR